MASATPAAPIDPQALDLKITQALTRIICNQPFFATILFRLRRVVDETCPTAWTDGTYLGYNPAFVMSLTRDELVGLMVHEVLHVAGLHPWRMGMRKNRPWNVACDAVVNYICTESGFTLPKGGIPGVADKSPEELYKEEPEDQQQGQGSGQGGEGQNNDPGGCGEVRQPTKPDGSPLSELEREQQMNETRIVVRQALNAAKKAGTLPAGLKRWAEDLLEPKVPWREVLARFVDSHSKTDYCIAPDTPVLRADLSWCRADALREGDELVGVDEYPKPGRNHRDVGVAHVEATKTFDAPRLKVVTDAVSLVVTYDHRFLVTKGGRNIWREARRLRVGDELKLLVNPWTDDRADTWLAGMLDGEGSVTANGPHAVRSGLNLRVSQVEGPVLTRLEECLKGLLPVQRFVNKLSGPSHLGKKPIWQLTIGAVSDVMRILGMYRPTRLLPKFLDMIRCEYFSLPRPGKSKVLSVEAVEDGPVVAVSTSSRTLITDGIISHNCWTRPNRRYSQSGIMFPSLWAETYGEIALGLDTSGSIDQATLREVCSEVLGALETYAERGQTPSLTAAWFDHAVYPQQVEDAEELQPKGGGGTSFRVVFEYFATREEPLPKAIIMVTDGYCGDFGEDPGIPVLWVLTQTHPGFAPPFGEITCTLNEA